MIYCVIPHELESELFEKMVERRDGPDRRDGQQDGSFRERRETRDRRRARATGTFPAIDAPA